MLDFLMSLAMTGGNFFLLMLLISSHQKVDEYWGIFGWGVGGRYYINY